MMEYGGEREKGAWVWELPHVAQSAGSPLSWPLSSRPGGGWAEHLQPICTPRAQAPAALPCQSVPGPAQADVNLS